MAIKVAENKMLDEHKRANKKARKRKEAEARNAAYQELPLEQKVKRNSTKVREKLIRDAGEQ